ncbi:hypothetical protein [Thalassobacillus pellis]|nr:hypothetical protein [Thalassobacillus pellis]MBM7554551.1 hypothetical protein [Thalassobacillus pellis]
MAPNHLFMQVVDARSILAPLVIPSSSAVPLGVVMSLTRGSGEAA